MRCLLFQVGENGAGHYVKMVHNGIEYGDMQLICETYQIMRDLLGMNNDEMSEVRVSVYESPVLPTKNVKGVKTFPQP